MMKKSDKVTKGTPERVCYQPHFPRGRVLCCRVVRCVHRAAQGRDEIQGPVSRPMDDDRGVGAYQCRMLGRREHVAICGT